MNKYNTIQASNLFFGGVFMAHLYLIMN